MKTEMPDWKTHVGISELGRRSRWDEAEAAAASAANRPRRSRRPNAAEEVVRGELKPRPLIEMGTADIRRQPANNAGS